MTALKLVLRNALRHRLRTGLTVTGLLVAVLAYGLLQTVVDAWYAGAAASSNARLITRNSISLVFFLPVSYENRIRGVNGVTAVARSNWFGGVYQEPKNFFPQFAVSDNYLNLYPEFILPEAQRTAYQRDRKGALVGRQLADRFGFKVGDTLPLRGTIFPGTWEFVVRGIFDGADDGKVTNLLLFHWDYLNETLRKSAPLRADRVGVYVLGIDNPDNAASVSVAVDAVFKNSLAETLTETEQAFQLGFVAMSNQIIAAIRIVSYVVILIIMAVMANTMAMSARERTSEYATLKALGFGPLFLATLIFGESLAICILGGGLGLALTPYAADAFKALAGGIFPIFSVTTETALAQAACALAVGILAAIVPAVRAARVRVVDGLRAVDERRDGEDMVPLNYIARNLWKRRLTTALTAGGLALVVFVFATVLMLDAGLKRTLVTTGEYDNVVVIRKGSGTEVQSIISREQANIIEMNSAVALGADGLPRSAKETVVLISLNRSGSERASNVVIRGTSPSGLLLRPQVKMTAGRLFRPGSSEIVVGSNIASGYDGTRIGERLRFAQREWIIVGTFDAGASGFDSEVWGDVDQLMQSFRRINYSAMVLKLADSEMFERFREELDADPRFAGEMKREQVFYSDQSRALSSFLSILGLTLTAIFSIGATIGAMITMYASVSNRVAEIGTLRALGFRSGSVLAAFLLEALLLGLVGGLIGLAGASVMQFVSFSTTNFQTFSDLSFNFLLTPKIALETLLFALLMGLLGGFLPAVRAARLNIVDALRAA